MAGNDYPPDLACVPSAIPAAERAAHFALGRKLFTELAEERTDLPSGYAFRFRPDALVALARFVANERKCCPFVSFEPRDNARVRTGVVAHHRSRRHPRGTSSRTGSTEVLRLRIVEPRMEVREQQ